MRHGKLRPGTAANKYKDALRKRLARRNSLGDADSNRDRVDQPVSVHFAENHDPVRFPAFSIVRGEGLFPVRSAVVSGIPKEADFDR